MKIDASDVYDMLEHDPHMLLIDVRSKEEFDQGHIPGAGCMPADDICDCLYDEALSERGMDALANLRGMELADDASVIVLYSNEGERSAQAATHMEAIGYVNVYDAGSLMDWPYDVVSTAEEAAVAAALSQSANVAQQEAPAATCGCGHDHGEAHHHAHDCGCGHHHE